jgi:hypothetical protein
LLAERGHDITVATRGRTAAFFSRSIRRANHAQPTNKESLKSGLGQDSWDTTHDQVCFSADDAAAIIGTIAGKTGRDVFCSSVAVYRDPSRKSDNPRRRELGDGGINTPVPGIQLIIFARLGRRQSFDPEPGIYRSSIPR